MKKKFFFTYLLAVTDISQKDSTHFCVTHQMKHDVIETQSCVFVWLFVQIRLPSECVVFDAWEIIPETCELTKFHPPPPPNSHPMTSEPAHQLTPSLECNKNNSGGFAHF